MAFRVIAEGTRTANWPDTRCSSRHQRLAAGETQTDIARSYNVSHVTIGRLQGAMLRPFEDAVGRPMKQRNQDQQRAHSVSR